MKKCRGLLFEERLFGCNVADWQHPIKLDFAEAVSFTKLVQQVNFNWNPEKPWTALAAHLFQTVYDLLLSSEDKPRLRLFVAIGTSLDRDHKTDAFFQIEGTSRIALLDAKAGNKSVLPEKAKRKLKQLPLRNRVIIRESDFDEQRLFTHKALKIIDWLSRDDARLRHTVDLKSLQQMLLQQWKEQKRRRKKREARERSGFLARVREEATKNWIAERDARRRVALEEAEARKAAILAKQQEQAERITNLKRFLGL